MDLKKTLFGRLPDGSEVDLYLLSNDNGLRAGLITYGAILVSLETPDSKGKSDDITLGYDSLSGYIENGPYFGAIIGRCANRIAKGRFVLDGVEYKLATNIGQDHLHGGIKGFNKVLWKAAPEKGAKSVGVRFSYLSKDGEEGYPGNLRVVVTYSLTNSDELQIAYAAETDKATPINLTHHGYYNLAGQGNGNILGHELMINADQYAAVDKNIIPTGEIKNLEGTPLDFRKPTIIGSRIAELKDGYDHNYVLRNDGASLTLAASVHEPASGRGMEVLTTEPGMQFYSGNYLDGTIRGKAGKMYAKHAGLCLETQHFPDSPNQPSFPSTILEPGKRFVSLSVYKFFTKS